MMLLHSLPSLANPREARVSRASSPYRLPEDGRSILARRVIRRHPFCVIWPYRAPPQGERSALNWRYQGRDRRARASRARRGRSVAARIGLRLMAGADLGSRVVASATHRGWATGLWERSRRRERAPPSGRPIAELGRDATQVIDQVRRLEARERAEPKRAPPNRAVAQVRSSQTSRCQPRSPNPETSR
jgi:hypothetical protein